MGTVGENAKALGDLVKHFKKKHLVPSLAQSRCSSGICSMTDRLASKTSTCPLPVKMGSKEVGAEKPCNGYRK